MQDGNSKINLWSFCLREIDPVEHMLLLCNGNGKLSFVFGQN